MSVKRFTTCDLILSRYGNIICTKLCVDHVWWLLVKSNFLDIFLTWCFGNVLFMTENTNFKCSLRWCTLLWYLRSQVSNFHQLVMDAEKSLKIGRIDPIVLVLKSSTQAHSVSLISNCSSNYCCWQLDHSLVCKAVISGAYLKNGGIWGLAAVILATGYVIEPNLSQLLLDIWQSSRLVH